MFFNFGGGYPGEMGGHPNSEVDNDAFYKTLGVPKTAEQDEIKRAFKKLAIKHHPDKGGDAEQFKEICRAYEVLSDPEKRRQYDQFGEAGLDGSATSGNDLFEMFFGGGMMGGRGRSRQRQERGEDVVQALEFTLEQFFKGATKTLAITRTKLCGGCEGRGGPESAVASCGDCRGQGVRIIQRRMGPMITQTQTVCDSCNGSGKYIPADKRCTTCKGKGTMPDRKTVDVTLPRGASNGYRVVLSGEADERPGVLPGDMIFVCKQKEHPIFKRSRDHLVMEKKITLREALIGTGFSVKCIDGETKFIKTAPNQIIKPDDILAVPNEGMPRGGSMFNRGNLYILFKVQWPESLTSKQLAILADGLPGNTPSKPSSDQEVVELRQASIEELQESAEMDDEDAGRGGNVGCRQV